MKNLKEYVSKVILFKLKYSVYYFLQFSGIHGDHYNTGNQ